MINPDRPVTALEFKERLMALCGRGASPGLPRKRRDRHILLRAVVQDLGEPGPYSEAEVDEALKTWISGTGSGRSFDHVALRRYLVDAGYLERDRAGMAYRVCLSGRGEVQFEAGTADITAAAVVRDARETNSSRKREWSS